MATIDSLFETSGLSVEEVAQRSGVSEDRVYAIAVGRWTPSPEDRQKIAAVFEINEKDVGWGHTVDPRNIRYRRTGISGDSS